MELLAVDILADDVDPPGHLRLGLPTVLFGRNGGGKSTLLRHLGDPTIEKVLYLRDFPEELLPEVVAPLRQTLSEKLFDPPVPPHHDWPGEMWLAAALWTSIASGGKGGVLSPPHSSHLAILAVGESTPATFWQQTGAALRLADGCDDLARALLGDPIIALLGPYVMLAVDTELLRQVQIPDFAAATDLAPFGEALQQARQMGSRFAPVAVLGWIGNRLGTPSVTYLTPSTDRLLDDLAEKLIPAAFDAYFGFDREGPESFLVSDDREDPWSEEDLSIRDGLVTVLSELTHLANDLLPTFVNARIVLEPTSALRRLTGAAPVTVGLVQSDDSQIDLSDASDGHQRWVAFAVREAAHEMLGFRPDGVEVSDGDGYEVYEGDPFRLDELLADAAAEGRLDALELHRVAAQPRPRVVALDEPELHLHPVAVREAVHWIHRRGERDRAVVVATHSPVVLNQPGELGHFCLVGRNAGGRIECTNVDGDLLGQISERAEAAGFDLSDLLQTIRACLLVEGIHDEKVLMHFFGAELRRQRVTIVPLFGAKQLKSFAQADFLSLAGFPFRVMFDFTTEEGLSGSRDPDALTQEEREMLQYLARLRERNVDVLEIPYSDPDVFCAIPPSAIRAAYPNVPDFNWANIIDLYIGEPKRPSFKRWLFSKLGLKQNMNVNEFLDRCLQEATTCEPNLTNAVNELLSSLDDRRGMEQFQL